MESAAGAGCVRQKVVEGIGAGESGVMNGDEVRASGRIGDDECSSSGTTTHSIPGPAILFVPATNVRALAKAPSLGADAVIYDLEDAVAPEARGEAREMLREALKRERPTRTAIRITHPTSSDFTENLLAARAAVPDAIVVPKVESAGDLGVVAEALDQTDAPSSLALWAMIETPRGVLDVGTIAAAGGRLAALVMGTNDLGAATGTSPAHMHPWRMAVVLAARAHGLIALDGVHNDLRDAAGCERAAREGAAMGFDGKTLVHPSQIAPARAGFRPDDDEIAHARAVIAAFRAAPEAGVLDVGGRMVERLHLAAALRTLARIGDRA